jgi:very-short-patch-repair endonuclease/predicted transcriptional regulator of viral defense system
MRSRGDDRLIAEVARRQHGVVGRWQLIREGLSEEEIDGRIRTGRLHPVRHGIYAVGHTCLSRKGRWLAAVLASGPDAVLSHYSAAALWMIRPSSRSIINVTDPVKSRSWDGIRRHHKALPGDEVTVMEGIPVTTVPRTIFDLAATEPLDVVKAMLREAEFRQLHDRLSLWDLVERYPGRRGVRKVKVALEALKDEPIDEYKSRFEERFGPFLRRHHLPRARFNQWILVGDKRFQVDCLWPDQRQIVELDGWEGHKTRTAFREDRARDRRLRVAGYGVTRLTWNQLEDEPESVAADLRALLTRPAPASLPSK